LKEENPMNRDDYEIDDEDIQKYDMTEEDYEEDLNDGFIEDDMFPDDNESYKQPLEMLKNMMKDDYDLTGRFGVFEEYYDIISDEFEVAGEELEIEVRSELAS